MASSGRRGKFGTTWQVRDDVPTTASSILTRAATTSLCGEHGIAGAATVWLVKKREQSGCKVLVSKKGFVPGSYTPQCAEYLSLLLGLDAVIKHLGCVQGRRVVTVGDSAPVVRHLQGGADPSPDSRQLVPLMELARRWCWQGRF